MLPQDVVPALLRSDHAAPRVTYYDDTPGPTAGERIELSARVLDNWVAKAANLLQDELDAGPGSRVRIELPPQHWRTVYWACAAWAVGAEVTGPGGPADVAVVSTPDDQPDGELVLVTLPALARTAELPVPPGAVDEAAELSTHGDRFSANDRAQDTDAALTTAEGSWTYADVVPDPSPGRRLVTGELAGVLRATLATWAGDGSVLLCRGTDEATLAHRLEVEEATR